MNPALVACLQDAPQVGAIDDLARWCAVWRSLEPAGAGTAALAMASGFAADRAGWAFAGGYQAALRALVPDLTRETLAAFCVTEGEGNRPRDVGTALTPQADGTMRVDGTKRWITLGPAASVLLVVGRVSATGAARPALRVARVPLPAPGVTLDPMPPTAFVPEVPHAQLRLQDLRIDVAALLPGDGYDVYVKPFRTLEDLHVTLAVLAYLLREARVRRWPAAFAEEAVAVLALLSRLADEDARDPALHVALAGALRGAHRLYAEARALWTAGAADPAARRWLRDAALFEVAGLARRQRAERAWERLGDAR